jgi:pimeloyl-ACP methyl ester carboxylesterase
METTMNAPVSLASLHLSLRTGTIRLSNGLDVSYAESGGREGLPLVLLHGYTDSWRSMAPLLASLPRRFRAIALSQRGHGDSGRPHGRYDIPQLADDLAAFLDHLGIDRAVIVGHSMGSLVAQRFALEQPRRVAALVLLGAFRCLRGNGEVEAFWRDAVASLRDPVDPALVRNFQQSTLAAPLPAAFLETVVEESLKVPAHVWRAALRGQIDEDLEATAKRIDAPTLILWGDQDAFSRRAEQAKLAAAIPDARLVAYRGAGHALHWEQPARVAADIAAFTDRVEVMADTNRHPRLRRA